MNQEIITAFNSYRAVGNLEDAFTVLSYGYGDDKRTAKRMLDGLRADIQKKIVGGSNEAEWYYELLRQSYFLPAPDFFDDYCIAVEWDRPLQNRFYLPRRHCLEPIVRQLQRLEDDELDLLGISAPPGIGKTAVACFFLCWKGGRHPSEGMLSGSHNGAFLRGLYEEVLRELDPEGEYAWGRIFNGHKVVKTNSLDMRIDIDKPSRFSTFQFSSIDSGNAGKVRAIQLLYCDDLVEGIEEAMSRDRLEKKWVKYTTDLKQRKQGNCKELHIATRWSVRDVLGRLEEEHENDPRAKFLKMTALNEKGESNFDYGGSIGFTTKFYEDMQKSMDDVSWRALYMSQPIEREGLLYDADTLRRYTELPEGEPDAILATCDTANGGGDFTVCAIFAVYGKDHYMIDCVCSDGLPEQTDPMLASALFRNKVKICQFESNSAGSRTADKVELLNRKLCEGGGTIPTKITRKHTQAEKTTKIIVNSPFVKENCLFKDDRLITAGSQYAVFMRQMLTYTVAGKNKHDDVPDCLAQYALFNEKLSSSVVTVMKRPF